MRNAITLGKAISFDGTEIAYEIEGTGPPFVLLHGFAANRHCWREKGYVDRLIHAGRQVILIDARGHGMSGKPHHPAYYADHKRAQDVIAVLDALRHPVADLHGFSMGGWIALATARTYPGRVRSFSINGAHGFAENLKPYRDALENGLDGWAATIRHQCDGVLTAGRYAQIMSNDLRALKACMGQDRRDLARDLQDIWLPSLTLCGEDEPFLEAAKAFAKAMSGRFVILRGRNHARAFCARDEVCDALIAFLDEIDHGQFSHLVDPRANDVDRNGLAASQSSDAPAITSTEPKSLQKTRTRKTRRAQASRAVKGDPASGSSLP